MTERHHYPGPQPEPSGYELAKRIDKLEKRVLKLQKRIKALTAPEPRRDGITILVEPREK